MKKYFNYRKREVKLFLLGMFLMFLMMANWSDAKRGFLKGWNSVDSTSSNIKETNK
ncbi:MAG: hypothetical protein ABIP95_05635 [Pelobium sp.]